MKEAITNPILIQENLFSYLFDQTAEIEIESDLIWIKVDNGYFWAETKEAGSIVKFGVKTRDNKGNRYPYFERPEFRATQLTKLALEYFGSSVNGLEFCYAESPIEERNDNYNVYITERHNSILRGFPIPIAQHQAIYKTWSFNRMAVPNNFTRVSEVKESSDLKLIEFFVFK